MVFGVTYYMELHNIIFWGANNVALWPSKVDYMYDVHTTYWIYGFFDEIYDKNL